MKHTNNNAIFNNAGKTGTALFVAGTFIVTGAIATVANFFKNVNAVDNTPSSAVGTTAEDPMAKLLILTEPFDINDADAVKARAKAIWEISDKKLDELDIANLIYILAGKKDLINYPESANTDSLKFEYLQGLVRELNSHLDDEISTFVEIASVGVGSNSTLTAVPSAYMFMPGKTVDGKLVQTEGQKKAIELTRMCLAQKNAIIKNDQKTLKANAESFYYFYKSIESMNISDYEKFILYKQILADAPIYTLYLTNEKADEIHNVTGIIATYQNLVLQAAAQGLDISKFLAAGNFGVSQPVTGEYHNGTDGQKADKLPVVNIDNKEGTTVEAEKGGTKLPSVTEVINSVDPSRPGPYTTRVEETTFVVAVTENTIKVTNPDTKETFVVEITGEGIYEYTIPGGESSGDVEYHFSDDEQTANELENTYTLG